MCGEEIHSSDGNNLNKFTQMRKCIDVYQNARYANRNATVFVAKQNQSLVHRVQLGCPQEVGHLRFEDPSLLSRVSVFL